MSGLLIATVVVWLLGGSAILGVLRGPGIFRRVRKLIDAVLLVILGVVLAGLLVISRAFLAFSGETLVGTVATRRVSPVEFELTYTPARSAQARQVRLRGDQWTVSGGIVKWHPWLTALGWTSYHKPMRLSGQFSKLEAQRRQPASVEPLYEPGVDRVWEALYWADPALPFVDAVYGSSAYAYVEPEAIQEIYVTPSGYLIKRAR